MSRRCHESRGDEESTVPGACLPQTSPLSPKGRRTHLAMHGRDVSSARSLSLSLSLYLPQTNVEQANYLELKPSSRLVTVSCLRRPVRQAKEHLQKKKKSISPVRPPVQRLSPPSRSLREDSGSPIGTAHLLAQSRFERAARHGKKGRHGALPPVHPSGREGEGRAEKKKGGALAGGERRGPSSPARIVIIGKRSHWEASGISISR